MSYRPRIMILDDLIDRCRALSDQLPQESYEVECIYAPSIAFSRLARQSYDLLLTDLLIPGMGGSILLRLIRQCDSDIPVIVFTHLESLACAITADHLTASCVLLRSRTSTQDLLWAVKRALNEPPPG